MADHLWATTAPKRAHIKAHRLLEHPSTGLRVIKKKKKKKAKKKEEGETSGADHAGVPSVPTVEVAVAPSSSWGRAAFIHHTARCKAYGVLLKTHNHLLRVEKDTLERPKSEIMQHPLSMRMLRLLRSRCATCREKERSRDQRKRSRHQREVPVHHLPAQPKLLARLPSMDARSGPHDPLSPTSDPFSLKSVSARASSRSSRSRALTRSIHQEKRERKGCSAPHNTQTRTRISAPVR